MKKFLIPILLLATILLSSNTIKTSSIDKKSLVDTKWHVDDTSVTISICFKKDNTFWNYFKSESGLDSMMLCNWELHNNKIILCNDTFFTSNFEVVSCNKQRLIMKIIDKNKVIKMHKSILGYD